ncbi:Coiled-coil domain-containing protein 47 [Sarcoptes scabiei]|uniref:PAT complex subunit CCDC47 n=1 Tax=Sarcoptes scabiei TaxID=52283 RepID=A0A834R4G0_SARSC|nr:Coiled-coil domain-containing protein 47 [Sarcoptes scabiei]
MFSVLLNRLMLTKLNEFLVASFFIQLVLIILIQSSLAKVQSPQESHAEYADKTVDDDEFAEFEDLDDDDEYIRPTPQSQKNPQSSESQDSHIHQSQSPESNSNSVPVKNVADSDEMIVDGDDDEEFETIRDEIDDEKQYADPSSSKDGIEITNIPLHLRTNWESYYLEFVIIFALIIYFVNYASGRSKNTKIATFWLEKNREILEQNFALVGDDIKSTNQNQSNGLIKETENIYVIWCSGRVSIDGLLIEIKLIKRHDLFSTIVNIVRPTSDNIIIKAFLSNDAMDNFVFCVAQRKIAAKLAKDSIDLATYCPERKSPEKYGVTSDNYLLLNEIGEAASFILDSKIVSLLDKNDSLIEFIHISDQYYGIKNDDVQTIKLPEVKKVLIISINLPSQLSSQNLDELDSLKPLHQMTYYLVDRLKRFRLSREKKLKSDRNRQKVEKMFLQSTHQQRQEAAQIKREERRRAEKEKMLQEIDPEKQRKWEEKEYKKELKKKIPKMKQLKVKAM